MDKPLDDFYKRYNGDPLTNCKECHKSRSRKQPQADRQIAVNLSEKIILEKLNSLGISSLPGKALGYRWADVVSWGCVLIECKVATDKGGGYYQWAFSPKQFTVGVRAHIVILCCDNGEDNRTFYVFDAKDPVFYHKDGKRKTAVTYEPNARHRRIDRVVLTKRMMLDHENQWGLIETYRKRIALQLTRGLDILSGEWRTK